MIELGKTQQLEVIRKTQIGLYLNERNNQEDKDILLPTNQVPKDINIGDEISVFIYKDSEDRIIATVKKPKLTIGDLAFLTVVENTKIGAFLDWGLEKDLFLPFKEQIGKLIKGQSCLVGLYVDNSKRLCATMRISSLLSSESPYKVDDRVKGLVYNVHNDIGAFVAIDNKYQGLIPNKEFYEHYDIGKIVQVRVTKVRPDGNLELSPRNKAYSEIEEDAGRIMNKLKQSGGSIQINDSSSPNLIKSELNMSKSAFKRAVGRLLKEGAIEITPSGIKKMW